MFLAGGAIFGFGLALSGMSRPEIVLSFLRFDDLGLLLVMGGAVLVALPFYHFWKRPLLADSPQPFAAAANRRTLAGSVIFGLGWGIAGVCPGAAIASLGTGNYPIALAIIGMFAGAYAQGRISLLQESAPAKSPTPSTHG